MTARVAIRTSTAEGVVMEALWQAQEALNTLVRTIEG
ncbi:MAG: hypothetical protein JWM33_2450 [Caulobacteraceae bacterium]|nr:hypothetical protein [Caulobacteraceae bacterium]